MQHGAHDLPADGRRDLVHAAELANGGQDALLVLRDRLHLGVGEEVEVLEEDAVDLWRRSVIDGIVSMAKSRTKSNKLDRDLRGSVSRSKAFCLCCAT